MAQSSPGQPWTHRSFFLSPLSTGIACVHYQLFCNLKMLASTSSCAAGGGTQGLTAHQDSYLPILLSRWRFASHVCWLAVCARCGTRCSMADDRHYLWSGWPISLENSSALVSSFSLLDWSDPHGRLLLSAKLLEAEWTRWRGKTCRPKTSFNS